MKPRTISLFIGGIAGALLGMLVAWILSDTERGTEVGPSGASRKKIRPADVVNLGVAMIGVIRQIANLRQQ